MKRSKLSLSHTKLASMNMGNIVPIGITEVIPGDTVQHATSALIRCSPLVTPPMHPVHVLIHHWFVPYRLIWDDFEPFITGGPDGMDASVYPTITSPASVGYAVGSLHDYLGVPTGVPLLEHSALPARAYVKIFNENYRDQDLVTPLVLDTTSGPDTTTNVTLQRAAWEKDYFTSARPWEQKGPQISIPIGTSAPIVRVNNAPASKLYNAGTNTLANPGAGGVDSGISPAGVLGSGANFAAQTYSLDPTSGMIADLTGASAITPTALREAMGLQQFEEARARWGSRYVEYLRYYGIRSSDARLQRPEYLGGGRQTIQFSEVLSTAESDELPIGSLKGHGIAAMRSNRYRRFFEEHGIVVSLMIVRPKTIYGNGLSRLWNRRVKEDFYTRELEAIGQQIVLNKEVYAAHTSPNGTFGFQDRYDEYRRTESSIAGEFRTVLDDWHFARIFTSDPALNATFITCDPPERPFAVQDQDVLYVMAKHSMQARRPVSATGRSFLR